MQSLFAKIRNRQYSQIKSKMRMNDNFNIITGESKPQFHHNTQNRRFASLEVIRALKENKGKDTRDGIYNLNHRKLGTAQDSKLYQYSYIPRDYSTINQSASNMSSIAGFQTRKKHSQTFSLMNATKVKHNLINHSSDALQTNWELTKKKSPVSKFTDLGRIYAPNYSDAYKEEANFGKKTALCTNICEIQRSYGTGKYFRKFK